MVKLSSRVCPSLEPLESRTLLSVDLAPHPADAAPADAIVVQAALDNQEPVAVLDASVLSGRSPLLVQFSGARSTDPDGDPLTYTWNFGDGSASVTGVNVQHTFRARGAYTVRLTVEDDFGGIDTTTVRILVDESPPEARITMPATGTLVGGGSVVRFSGTASDPEDGFIPASRYTWRLVRLTPDGEGTIVRTVQGQRFGRLRIPVGGNADPDTLFLLTLTVRDSAGLATTDTVTLQPRVAPLVVQTNFPGLRVRVNGELVEAGTFPSVVGMNVAVSAPPTQVVDGTTYRFLRWSDGGARTHNVRVGVGGRSLFALYRITSFPGMGRAQPQFFASSNLTFASNTPIQPNPTSSFFSTNNTLAGNTLQRGLFVGVFAR